MSKFRETFDVVVVGFGYAGGIAALNAAQSGAKTLLIEKASIPGGMSVCAYGTARSARDPEEAFQYLKVTNGGRTPEDVMRVLAHGMFEIESYLRELAKVNNAVVTTSMEQNALLEKEAKEKKGAIYNHEQKSFRRVSGNYPFPGTDSLYASNIADVPGFDIKDHYPWANGVQGGARLFKVVHDNLLKEGKVEIRYDTAALRLITAPETREIRGVRVTSKGTVHDIGARRGVILTTGGFEGSADMKAQFLEGMPILSVMARMNTGDGIRMAQDVGAALWHMWHIHGAYGFRHTDPDYPYAIRLKRFPDYFPGKEHELKLKMPWILLDQNGRRFMAEYQPYTQDTTVRPMQYFDPVTQRFPRNPAFMICDEVGRSMYALGRAVSNDVGIRYDWSDDNLKEVENGILKRAESLSELARLLGVDATVLEQSVARWNAQCASGADAEFGRPAGTMLPIQKAPFYGAPVFAIATNTQGGVARDGEQRVINVFGEPIPRLYAAGEVSSSLGHLYLSGSNITECFVSGRIAGRNAAKAEPWELSSLNTREGKQVLA